MIDVGKPFIYSGFVGYRAIYHFYIELVPVHQIQKLKINDPPITFFKYIYFFNTVF